MRVVKGPSFYSLLPFLPNPNHCLSLCIPYCRISSGVLAFIFVSLLVYVSRLAPCTVSARKATIASALTSGSVYASVSLFTFESVSSRPESGVSTYTSASVSPGVSASISASVSCRELNSAFIISLASVLLIVCSSFSDSVSVCRQHSWPVLKKTSKPCD